MLSALLTAHDSNNARCDKLACWTFFSDVSQRSSYHCFNYKWYITSRMNAFLNVIYKYTENFGSDTLNSSYEHVWSIGTNLPSVYRSCTALGCVEAIKRANRLFWQHAMESFASCEWLTCWTCMIIIIRNQKRLQEICIALRIAFSMVNSELTGDMIKNQSYYYYCNTPHRSGCSNQESLTIRFWRWHININMTPKWQKDMKQKIDVSYTQSSICDWATASTRGLPNSTAHRQINIIIQYLRIDLIVVVVFIPYMLANDHNNQLFCVRSGFEVVVHLCRMSNADADTNEILAWVA